MSTITRHEKVNGQDTLRPTNIQYLQILTNTYKKGSNTCEYGNLISLSLLFIY